MESIRAIVTRVFKADPETGRVFVGIDYETPDGLVSTKAGGYARGLREGDCFSAEGTWKTGTYKGQPDETFQGRQFRPDIPRTAAGAERFLAGCLRPQKHGVSAEAVRRFVAARGAEGLREAVDRPEILVALSQDPARYRAAILEDWSARTQGGQAVSLMEASGLEAKAIERIVSVLRDEVLKRLRDNPYQVARIQDVGFDAADRIGRHLGFAPGDRNRLTAAVTDVLRREEGAGSTAVDLDTLMAGLSTVSRIDRGLLLDFLRDAARRDDHDIAIYDTPAGPMSALLRLYVAEVDIQSAVKSVLSSGRANAEADVRRTADALFAKEKFRRFDAIQRLAVEMAATEPFSVLTGGPGTGKSTVMEAAAALCEQLDPGKLILCAPTGKAAKRLEEATGRPASTVHRVLKARGGRGGTTRFGHNRGNPLPAGAVVVVDEASMLDADTAAALMNAMPPDGRLLLVGDRNQLPSVGAGSVLADLLSAESGGRRAVPSVELVNVYRQAKDSGIAKGAVLVKNGEIPDLGEEDRGGVSFREMAPDEIADAVERLVCEELPAQGFHPVRDVAVLCPMSVGPAGTWALNARLSARLNPDGAPLPGVSLGPSDDPRVPVPRSGDRVMLTENDAENDVMNGDLGTVVGPGRAANGRPTIRVAFDSGVEVEYPASKWRSLILAFAGTIHKSQGSQYKVVVMPMAMSQERMLERTLVYTGWTRAQSRLVLLGERAALEHGIRTYRGEDRSTLLRRFLSSLDLGRILRPGARDWFAAARHALAGMRDASAAAPKTADVHRPPALGRLFGARRAAPQPSPATAAPPPGAAARPPPLGQPFGRSKSVPPTSAAVAAPVAPPGPPRPAAPRPLPLGGLFGARPSMPTPRPANTDQPAAAPPGSPFGMRRAVPPAALPPSAPAARAPSPGPAAPPAPRPPIGRPFGFRPRAAANDVAANDADPVCEQGGPRPR